MVFLFSLIILLLLPWVFFDIGYFLKTILMGYVSRMQRLPHPPGPLSAQIYNGICLTSDLGFMLHMNNQRYLREFDFARYDYWIKSHIFKAVKTLKCSITNKANYIRYRTCIEFLERFYIRTKLVYWDDECFYLEQRMIRKHDEYVCAVNYTCHTLTGAYARPKDVLESLYNYVVGVPEAPPEIQAWIHLAKLSAQVVRFNE